MTKQATHRTLLCGLALLAVTILAVASRAEPAVRVDGSTLNGKLIMGFSSDGLGSNFMVLNAPFAG